MNLTPVQFFSKRSPKGAIRLCRLIAATLSLFILTAVPALAEPITAKQVVQTLSSSQGTLDLRLNTLVAQDPATTKSGTQQNGPRADGTQQGGIKSDSMISGVIVTAEGQQLGVDYEEGEVDGTICDCGEIPPIITGGFPKWPFLFLAAVPLAFIDHCDDCEERNETPTPTPTPPSEPTPTPTPSSVPEPGSLFLLGTGLAAAGAGLRRRYAKMKMAQQTHEEEE
ncbi:MAG TPA: PEP-CTERM sorting domain-containing protein [Pyrinomonadaceae bacterium]|nr:PEP-CTERM sorting domain-containing protein [Pyrinomonadaceae bacterium]